jgi:iron complex transport system permease protein
LTAGKFLLVNGLLLLLLLLSILAGSLLGPGGTVWSSLWPLDPALNPEAAVLLLARLPRVLLAALVGAALSGVGVAFQALLRNPLADPFVMGVSGGAALGGTVALVAAGSSAPLLVQGPAAFVGGILATLLIYRTGRVGGRVDTVTLLLVGVIFNTFASAVITFLKIVVSSQKTQELLVWLMGSLGYCDYGTLALVAAVVVLGLGILAACVGPLNA